ncbi:MAG: prepilin peptidase [Hyphomicrobiales bacterium]|nr:prepilin peptidase [Hyphomicrobiales bacterium]
MQEVAIASVFPALAAMAGAGDLISFRIPNWLTAALALAFAVLAPAAGVSAPDLLAHAFAGCGVLAGGVILFHKGLVGGGDAKFAAGCALWLGPGALYDFFIATTLAGGALALGLTLARGGWIAAAPSARPPRLFKQGEPAPYGAAIAAGAVIGYSSSPMLQRFLLWT